MGTRQHINPSMQEHPTVKLRTKVNPKPEVR